MTYALIVLSLLASTIFYYKGKHVSLVESESEINTSDWYKETLIQYDIESCHFGVLTPEYALITEEDILGDGNRDYELLYYQIENRLPFTSNWQITYTGGTTVYNTTFPELVKMVKADCGQFQKSKGNHDDPTINWSYSPYIPEPELTPEEKAEQERQDLVENLRLELEWLTEKELADVKQKYGISKGSMDRDFIRWYEQGLKDGYFQPYAK
ncbi:MAG: hypothetical protein PHU25_01190 [Deltaproteobacteria bacterium]|nr:hypothetical protein [Deltaproteobacteria bacterium]